MLKGFDYFFLIRPVLLIPVWTIFLLGYYHGIKYLSGAAPIWGSQFLSVFPTIFFWTCIVGGIYILNQIHDRETDRLNQKLFLIAEGHVPVRMAYTEMLLLYATGLLGALFLLYSPFQTGIFAISILIGFVYSCPPMSLKNRPWLGLLSNMLGHGIIGFAVGWFAVPGNGSDTLAIFFRTALPYSLGIGIIYLCTTVPDIPGDKQSGKITMGVRYGRERTAFLIAILFGLMFLWSVIIFFGYERHCTISHIRELPPLLFVSLLTFPFFVIMVRKPLEKNINMAVKVSVLAISMAVAFFFWWYFIIIFLVLVSSRIYYKRRFGLNYPTVRPYTEPEKT